MHYNTIEHLYHALTKISLAQERAMLPTFLVIVQGE